MEVLLEVPKKEKIFMQSHSKTQALSEHLIREFFTLFNAEKWTEASLLLSDQVMHDINQGPRVIGREPFLKYLVETARYYKESLSHLFVIVSEDGSRGSAEFYVHGEYLKTHGLLPKANGQKYEGFHGVFFEIEDQQISRFSHYFNYQSFLEQLE